MEKIEARTVRWLWRKGKFDWAFKEAMQRNSRKSVWNEMHADKCVCPQKHEAEMGTVGKPYFGGGTI
ncbi:hypothetical protein ACS0TY_036055 [Phlomoides rotata]